MEEKETKNEMIIYQSGSINTVDVYHLIQSQVQTINNQSRVIKMLEAQITQVKLDAKQELHENLAHHSNTCWECGQPN